MLLFALIGEGWGRLLAWVRRHPYHRVGHAHQQYGPRTAFGIGAIHGVGAETGTQVLLIAAATGATAGSGATTFNLALPAGAVAGDALVAAITYASSTTTVSAPTGWTKLGTGVSQGSIRSVVFWKSMTSGDTGPFAFTSTVSAKGAGVLVAVNGASTLAPGATDGAFSSGVISAHVQIELVSQFGIGTLDTDHTDAVAALVLDACPDQLKLPIGKGGSAHLGENILRIAQAGQHFVETHEKTVVAVQLLQAARGGQ